MHNKVQHDKNLTFQNLFLIKNNPKFLQQLKTITCQDPSQQHCLVNSPANASKQCWKTEESYAASSHRYHAAGGRQEQHCDKRQPVQRAVVIRERFVKHACDVHCNKLCCFSFKNNLFF